MPSNSQQFQTHEARLVIGRGSGTERRNMQGTLSALHDAVQIRYISAQSRARDGNESTLISKLHATNAFWMPRHGRSIQQTTPSIIAVISLLLPSPVAIAHLNVVGEAEADPPSARAISSVGMI